MKRRILSFDVATKTGWAFYNGNTGKFDLGLIETNPKDSEAQRLAYFRKEIIKLFKKYKPTHIVMEDIYAGKNIKTLKLLAKFAGVAEECSMTELNIAPYIIHTSTVKSYFKTKTKEDLFNFVSVFLKEEFNFKEHNDIVDAYAQLVCYYDEILKFKKFRTETDYGFSYEV